MKRPLTFIPPDETPRRDELLAEVDRLVYIAAGRQPTTRTVTWENGGAVIHRDPSPAWLPAVGSTEWWDAPAPVRIAALVVLGAAWLTHDPERTIRERLRSMSWDLAEGFRERRPGPSHDELEQRRAQPGPVHSVDPVATARWVETGHSEGDAA